MHAPLLVPGRCGQVRMQRPGTQRMPHAGHFLMLVKSVVLRVCSERADNEHAPLCRIQLKPRRMRSRDWFRTSTSSRMDSSRASAFLLESTSCSSPASPHPGMAVAGNNGAQLLSRHTDTGTYAALGRIERCSEHFATLPITALLPRHDGHTELSHEVSAGMNGCHTHART